MPNFRFPRLNASKISNNSNDFAKDELFETCKMEDNPNRILKLARGKDEAALSRYVSLHPDSVLTRDKQCRTALHVTMETGNQKMVRYLLDAGSDVNSQAQSGNTAIHFAVDGGHDDIAKILIQNGGVDMSIANNEGMPPLHMAVQLRKLDVLKVILATDPCVVRITDEFGRTALHMAAVLNEPKAIEALLDRESSMFAVDKKGMIPFHAAAAAGATDAMKVFLERADASGVQRSEFLNVHDNERNMPLHAAVCGGHWEAAVLCILNGGDLEGLQDNGSTPLHFASARGCHNMLKCLIDAWKKVGKDAVHAVNLTDSTGMTPLHFGAMFDHAKVVEFLLNEGANVNAQDNDQRTPFYLSAAKSAFAAWELLLKRGADPSMTDNLNRNFFHAAILNDSKPEVVTTATSFCTVVSSYMHKKDIFGCTPLHYATEMGYIASALALVKHGAKLNCINNDLETPMHFAAKNGRYNTCRALLKTEEGSHMINMQDKLGRSIVHLAADNGHEKVVTLLMRTGAVMYKDVFGNLPIHLAAEQNYPKTVKALLGFYPRIADSTNNDGNTPLHAAALRGCSRAICALLDEGAGILYNNDDATFFDVIIQNKYNESADEVFKHRRWRDVMNTRSRIYGCYMLGLLQNLPTVAVTLLDRCLTEEPCKEDPKQIQLVYDFRYLQMPMAVMMQKRREKQPYQPLPALNLMVQHDRTECITHPVCKAYLDMKWEAYGSFSFGFNIGIYVLFLACLTYIVCEFDNRYHSEFGGAENTEFNRMDGFYGDRYTRGMTCALVFLALFAGLNFLKELYQLWAQRMSYFMDMNNYVELGVYISTGVFCYPALMNMSTHVQWEAAAVATLLGYVNFLLFFQRTSAFGLYVVMFINILSTLVKVLVVFFILFAAFSFSFYILLAKYTPAMDGFHDPFTSFLTVGMMMIGEINYRGSFLPGIYNNNSLPTNVGTDREDHFPLLTLLLLACFLIIMPILLMNLMIGLAVGDIESVQRDALLKRTAMQVDMQTDLERKIPPAFLERRDKQVYRPGDDCWFTRLVFRKSTCRKRQNKKPTNVKSGLEDEINKQKQRIKDMSVAMEKQTTMLRLIIQKMEIRTEAENEDEGISPAVLKAKSRWSSLADRYKSSQKADEKSILAAWQSSTPASRDRKRKKSGDTNVNGSFSSLRGSREKSTLMKTDC